MSCISHVTSFPLISSVAVTENLIRTLIPADPFEFRACTLYEYIIESLKYTLRHKSDLWYSMMRCMIISCLHYFYCNTAIQPFSENKALSLSLYLSLSICLSYSLSLILSLSQLLFSSLSFTVSRCCRDKRSLG